MNPPRPPAQNVGILALHFHLPCYAVRQEDLERAHGAPAGKYTAGLGQRELGFGPGGAEDACSRALSACDALLQKHGGAVSARRIGRVDVGTETSPDRSKSIASVICGWLARRVELDEQDKEEGARRQRQRRPLTLVPVEAVDHTHACYGGAAALFAAAAWIESSAWDGQSLALVVATDGASYAPGSPAVATGGGGAAAFLVGAGAPLVLEGWPRRASAAAHAWDFYKPHGRRTTAGGGGRGRTAAGGRSTPGGGGGASVLAAAAHDDDDDDDDADPSCPHWSSHFPVVDGPASTDWFLAAADAAARRWHEQQQQAAAAAAADAKAATAIPPPTPLLESSAAFVCHSPFARMVRKALGRLALQDAAAFVRWRVAVAAEGGGGGGSNDKPHVLLRADALSRLSAEQVSALRGAVAFEAGLPLGSPALGALLGGKEEEDNATPAAAPPAAKAVDAALAAALESELERLAADGLLGQTRVGNAYTASVFLGLASLLERRAGGKEDDSSHTLPPFAPGDRILAFSFGSGVSSTLFSLRVAESGGRVEEEGESAGEGLPPTAAALGASQDLARRLSARPLLSPEDFDAAAAEDEVAACSAPYEPPSVGGVGGGLGGGNVSDLPAGVWYLARVDGRYRRVYARRGEIGKAVEEDEVLEGAVLGGGGGGGG
jgi:3-hydroxy-3-methylglutaryl CoA synthase